VLRLSFATYWPLLVFLVLPPFVVAGAFLSLVLRANVERAGRLYAADLAGGATGALAAVAALGALRGPVNSALVLALLAAGFAWWWTRGRESARRLAPAGFALVLAALVAHAATGIFSVDYRRAPQKLLARMLHPTPQGTPHLLPKLQRWDAYSRVDVVELDTPRGVQRHVYIDGETPTPMLSANAAAPGAAALAVEEALAALPLRIRATQPAPHAAPRDVLSIGSGGGYDVVLARRFGAQHVDAVELNAGVLAVVAATRDFNGDVYRQPGVRAFHAEGRQFARRAAPQSYDLVLLALAQSLAGNLQEYALSECYLYTREAFIDYLRVLRPGGAVAFLVSSPAVQEKLVRTATDVLTARGLDAAQCIAAVSSPREVPYDNLVLLRADPFTPSERATLQQDVLAHGYLVAQLPPGIAPEAPRRPRLAPLVPARPSASWAPATDARPFFFHLEPGTPAGLRLLLVIAWIALGAALLGLVLGLERPRTPGATPAGPLARAAARQTRMAAGAYFTLLGLGFMMVEILVLQRTLLVIGFPTLNLSLVLAIFLVAAGCGSATSMRFTRRRELALLLVVLGPALATLLPILGALHAPLDRLPLALRCVVLAAVLFPFGFAMGMPFPSGLRLLPADLRPLVPWLWGINGVASIAGSALVVAVALEAGLPVTGLLPAGLYVLAALPLAGFAVAGGATAPSRERAPE
jgi:SAM-dependent methyltransferase